MQAEQQSENRKGKGAVANARVGLIDKETGEVIDEGSLIYVQKRVRIKGFFMGMQEGFESLAKRRIGAEALNVLMFLIGRMGYENITRMTHKEIAEPLAMKRQNVNRNGIDSADSALMCAMASTCAASKAAISF